MEVLSLLVRCFTGGEGGRRVRERKSVGCGCCCGGSSDSLDWGSHDENIHVESSIKTPCLCCVKTNTLMVDLKDGASNNSRKKPTASGEGEGVEGVVDTSLVLISKDINSKGREGAPHIGGSSGEEIESSS